MHLDTKVTIRINEQDYAAFKRACGDKIQKPQDVMRRLIKLYTAGLVKIERE